MRRCRACAGIRGRVQLDDPQYPFQLFASDTMAKNIYQQICNGTYRSTELLEVIARELDAQT